MGNEMVTMYVTKYWRTRGLLHPTGELVEVRKTGVQYLSVNGGEDGSGFFRVGTDAFYHIETARAKIKKAAQKKAAELRAELARVEEIERKHESFI